MPEVPDRVPPFRIWKHLPWATVVLLALACGGLLQLVATLRAQNALLRDQQALLEVELRSTRQQLEAERILSRHETDALRAARPSN